MKKEDSHAPFPLTGSSGEEFVVGGAREFERLYERLYARLCAFAFMVLHDRELAEDAVQEAFLSLWRRRDELHIHASIDHYLMRSVYNQALMRRTREPHHSELRDQRPSPSTELLPEGFSDEDVRRLELVEAAIRTLREQCRRIFLLNKHEGMRQKEIAAHLAISVKTVDTQITRAMKKIREYVQQYQNKK